MAEKTEQAKKPEPKKPRVSKEQRLADRERKLREQTAKLQGELRQIEEAKRAQKRRRFTRIAEGIADEAVKLGLDEVPIEVWKALLAESRDALLKKAGVAK